MTTPAITPDFLAHFQERIALAVIAGKRNVEVCIADAWLLLDAAKAQQSAGGGTGGGAELMEMGR